MILRMIYIKDFSMDAIDFVIGLAIWFLVIVPVVYVLQAKIDIQPQWQEHITDKMKRDMYFAKLDAEIMRLEMQNIALRTYAEMHDREQRMSYDDVQSHFDCSQCCQFSCSPIRDAGTVDVLRDEIKALPEK